MLKDGFELAECPLHGENMLWVFVEVCEGYVCSGCIKDNYYRDDITEIAREKIFKFYGVKSSAD